MKYFDLVDELFVFKYLLTEDNLNELPSDMLENPVDLNVYVTSSVVDFDERMRTERNIKLYQYTLRCMPLEETEINSLDELIDLIQFKSKTGSGADTLITNVSIAAKIHDMPDFIPAESREITPGYPFVVGTIGNLKIVADPYLRYEDTNLFFYNKSDIIVASYIKDIKVENEATFNPSIKSNLAVYKKYKNTVLKVLVNIPVEELS